MEVDPMENENTQNKREGDKTNTGIEQHRRINISYSQFHFTLN